MKKFLLAALLGATAGTVHAQFFQQYYAHAAYYNLTDGLNTRVGGLGFLAMGNNDDSYSFDRMNMSGGFSGGFSRQYYMYLGSTPMVMQRGGSVVETNIPGGNNYAFATANPEGFCFGTLQPNGNLSVLQHYPLGIGGVAERALIANSTQTPGSAFFISGRYNNQMYVARVTNTGAVIWSNWYTMNGISNMRPAAMIQSRGGAFDLVIVGACNFTSPVRGDDAFFLRLDPATGTVINTALYGAASTNEGFNSILESANPASPGYVIGGQVNLESWSVKVNNTGTSLLWDYIYKATGTTSYALTGVVERKNTTGAFEYFAVCRDMTNKALVYKLDANGRPVGMTYPGAPRDQFQYTAATSTAPTLQTTGVDVDVHTNGLSNDGLSVFGYVTDPGLPGTAHYTFLAKTYFNGVVGCGEVLRNANNVSGPPMLPTPTTSRNPLSLSPATVIIQVNNTVIPTTLCTGEVIPGGSNARKANPGVLQQLTVSPNPVTDMFTVSGPVTEGDGTVKVELVDMLGHSVYVHTLTGMQSQFSLSLSRSSLNCAAGMYLLNVYNGAHKETLRLVFASN